MLSNCIDLGNVLDRYGFENKCLIQICIYLKYSATFVKFIRSTIISVVSEASQENPIGMTCKLIGEFLNSSNYQCDLFYKGFNSWNISIDNFFEKLEPVLIHAFSLIFSIWIELLWTTGTMISWFPHYPGNINWSYK